MGGILGEEDIVEMLADQLAVDGAVEVTLLDLTNAYAADVCRTLREVISPSMLHESCKYSVIKGYTVSR